jgi:hypothetical protein
MHSTFSTVFKFAGIGALILVLIGVAALMGSPIHRLDVLGIGIEFKDKVVKSLDTNNENIDNLKAEVAQLKNDLAQLVEDVKAVTDTRLTAAKVRELPTEQGAVTEPVLAATPVEGKGWIWLGAYDWTDKEWTTGSLADLQQLGTPQTLLGKVLKLGIDVNVREEKPLEPDKGYFSGIPSKGFAQGGTEIKIIGTPQPYGRESGWQYWAEVETRYIPKGGDTRGDARASAAD